MIVLFFVSAVPQGARGNHKRGAGSARCRYAKAAVALMAPIKQIHAAVCGFCAVTSPGDEEMSLYKSCEQQRVPVCLGMWARPCL